MRTAVKNRDYKINIKGFSEPYENKEK